MSFLVDDEGLMHEIIFPYEGIFILPSSSVEDVDSMTVSIRHEGMAFCRILKLIEKI